MWLLQEQLAAAEAKLSELQTEADASGASEAPNGNGPAEQTAESSQAAAELEELRAKLPEVEALAARVPELEATIAELQAVKVHSPHRLLYQMCLWSDRFASSELSFSVLLDFLVQWTDRPV